MDSFQKSDVLLRLDFTTEARLRHILTSIWQSLGLLLLLTFLMPYTCALSNQNCAQIMRTDWMPWLPLWGGTSPSIWSWLWHIVLLVVAVWLFRNMVLNVVHGIFHTELVFEEKRLYWYVPALNWRTRTILLQQVTHVNMYHHNIDLLLTQSPPDMTLRANLTPWPLLSYHARDFTNSHLVTHSLPTLVMLYCPHLTCRFLQK